MSDQINEFDHIFSDRLADQTATPPPAVWENIKSTRTFGHVVANRISTNWRVFGTLLMLLFAGGSSVILLGEEDSKTSNQVASTIVDSNEKEVFVENKVKRVIDIQSVSLKNGLRAKETKEFGARNDQEAPIIKPQAYPSWDLIASLQQAAFVRPVLEDARLSAYIESLEGWESAKPKSFVRFYQMDPIEMKPIDKRKINPKPESIEIDYDYVMPQVERKTFAERSSILLYFTPQSIRKIMKAEYNLSSSYLEERQKTEKTRLAYSFGAMLHYELKNNKFIETGIQFTQIYEEMSYEGEKRFSNQYDFIEIPILLGYGERNAKWGWEIKGGFGLQVFNNYKGYILKSLDEFGKTDNPTPQFRVKKSDAVRNIIANNHRLSKTQARHEVLNLENKDENPFKTCGVLNLHLAAGLTYYHSIKTTFVITPRYQRSINSITTKDAMFRENINYMGISFGTRINF